MTTIYPQLLQEFWQRERNKSYIDELMKPYQNPVAREHTQTRRQERERTMSRIAHEEAQAARESLNIRNFGYHWLKPLGTTKTMGQIADEEREVHDSYEAYEDEDGEFNQNILEGAGPMEGQEIASEGEHDDGDVEEEEAADLDEEIEEGASFDVGETSVLSSVHSSTPAMGGVRLYTMVNGVPYTQGPDGSLVAIRNEQDTSYEQGEQLLSEGEDEGMLSAEEGSIGEYSSDEQVTDPESI